MTKTTEVTKVEDIVKKVTGIKVRYFRYPGGCYGGSDLNSVKALGERPIGWDCYFGDSLNWTASQQVANVKDSCQQRLDRDHAPQRAAVPRGVYKALKVLHPVVEGPRLAGREHRHDAGRPDPEANAVGFRNCALRKPARRAP